MNFESRADMASFMPPGMAERMGRMESLGHQAVLAFVDGDREHLAKAVNQIATYDDEPGRAPYPLPRFDFAVKRVLDTVNMLFDAHDRVGGVSNEATAEGARGLVEEFAPEQFQQSALEHFAAVPGGKTDMDLAVGGKQADEGTLLVVTAAAAWLGTRPNVLPVRQDFRQMILKTIRDADSDARGVPEAERVSSISDKEARDFLDQLFPPAGSYPFPYDPREWTVGEREVIGTLKNHLLNTPASASTPEQIRELKGEIIAVLRRALDDMGAAAAGGRGSASGKGSTPPSRSGLQPKKDKPKRPKRHKPSRRKK